VFQVHDNGQGFDPAIVRAGLGLRSMRERAEALGATLHMQSDASGALIRVVLPGPGADRGRLTVDD
jgi:signal transduction histidine kinase